MPSPFKRAAAVNVGVANTVIYTVPADKVVTLIDCTCANVEPGLTEVKGNVQLVQGANTVNLIKSGPIPVGSAMVVVGGPRKVVMIEGDIIRASCDKANGMDVSISFLEQAE